MLRKIKKLILHPNRYFFDYLRKRHGFKKYFVTEIMKPYREAEDRTWYKLFLSYPSFYLYDFFRKRLHKVEYPILIDYRIETLTDQFLGGGNRVVLAVELEGNNTVYFADANFVLKALSKQEPYIAMTFLRIKFRGRGNKVFMGGMARLSRGARITFVGSYNTLSLGMGTIIHPDVSITFKGANNALYLGKNCRILREAQLIFKRNGNCIYLGDNSNIHQIAEIRFNGNNALIYACGKSSIVSNILIWSNSILFTGFGTSLNSEKHYVTTFRAQDQKNIIIGSATMITRGCYYRNSDGHLLYDANTNKRISLPKSIIVGNDAWIGQRSLISKGTIIEDGATIGANSVVSNKRIPARCVAAGNPARVIRQDVIIDRRYTGTFLDGDALKYDTYEPPDPEKEPIKIPFDKLIKIDEIDHNLSAKEKIKLIRNILADLK